MKFYRRIGVFFGALIVAIGIGAVATPASAAAYPSLIGPYTISPYGSNKCLDIAGVSYENGAYAQLYDCLGRYQTNQVFYIHIVPGSSDRYQIIASHSWKCLDVEGVSQSPGARIQQYDCQGYGQANQIFYLFNYYSNYFSMAASHSGQAITYQGLWNGATVFQYPVANAPYWKLTHQ